MNMITITEIINLTILECKSEDADQVGKEIEIINLTILECKSSSIGNQKESKINNKSNHIGM